MSLPTSLHAYVSEMEAYDQAKSKVRGIRISFGTNFSGAQAYRARLHNARVLDRKENTRGVASDHPMYGKSDFDNIIVSIRQDVDDNYWVYLEKNGDIPGKVEEL